MPAALQSVMPQPPERAPRAPKPNPQQEVEGARGELDKALSRADSSDRKHKLDRAAIADGAETAVYAAETLGVNFVASLTEGYLGPERMKVAGIDPRPVLGLGAVGYGIYRILTRQMGGGHAVAVGAGAMNSWVSSVGVRAGQGARDRWGTPQAAAVPTVQITAPSVQGAQVGRTPRVVVLTPPADRAREPKRPRHAHPVPAEAEVPQQPKHRRFPRAER